ncbi:MipA/OmpV family protein [Glaciecola sp. 1036]|uniref:MipA/OmpV family protein n=1 Tax=Alteromonadaceae TaxID=72275 RepID=UPI003D075FA7
MLFLLLFLPLMSANASEPDCETSVYCIDENSWQLGIAMGLGGRTNPLVDGDAVPFLLLPDIAYYGESFYFDNGELGFQFYPTQNTSIETFIAPNSERANFSFWHPSNILIPAASFGSDATGIDDELELSIEQIETRKWAIDGGIRLQWYHQSHHFQIKFITDVSGVHNGQQINLAYRYLLHKDNWRLNLGPQVKWMSSQLTDYYYGVRKGDTPIEELFYEASSGFQYGLDLNASYAVNAHWQWLFRTSYTKLHEGMSDSPIVEDDYVASAFVGIAYRF